MLQLTHLQDFQAATPADICRVHIEAYVHGLRKAALSGAEFVEHQAPTFCTSTTYDDALLVCVFIYIDICTSQADNWGKAVDHIVMPGCACMRQGHRSV